MAPDVPQREPVPARPLMYCKIATEARTSFGSMEPNASVPSEIQKLLERINVLSFPNYYSLPASLGAEPLCMLRRRDRLLDENKHVLNVAC